MLKPLNPLIHSELRLAVMSMLMELQETEFVFLKEQTGSTSGNLSVQIDKLSKAGYIEVEKSFKGRRPCTTCRITDAGIAAFEEYVNTLKDYIRMSDKTE